MSATQAYTKTQTPDNSILDLNGRQIYLGNGFVLPAAGTSLANTDETPIAVISNASSNTKSMFLFNRGFASNLNPVLVRTYKNPTLNVPGNTTAPLNLRTSYALTSVATCYLGASITANGTLMDTKAYSLEGGVSNILIVIDPGVTILFTAQQAAVGTSLVTPELAWYEI